MNAITRRDLLKVASTGCLLTLPGQATTSVLGAARRGVVRGHMTGAQALAETLQQEGVECVYGIPGAQENELWDTFKSRHINYLLVSHEFSAAAMADGYARVTGKPGVLCVVPGPGVTNSLSGMGEALLDSIPMVAIVGDVGNGAHEHAFQVHALDHATLLRPVTKQVISVQTAAEIPHRVREAFQLARAGEPGPVAVIVPYNLFIEAAHVNSGPLEAAASPWDDQEARRAYALLSDRRLRVGIYAGLGCMPYSPMVVHLAELLQAPVATSMAGKGVMPEDHPLAVGWGYGPQGTLTAELAFRQVDLVLAMGVKFGEVSTGFYSLPQHRCLIHVDINPNNLGRVMRTSVSVPADSGMFMSHILDDPDTFRRDPNGRLVESIRQHRCEEARVNGQPGRGMCVDPMAFLLALRRNTSCDVLAFVDVTLSQYWATEVFTATQPRSFFNPTNNQNMGWSIPAAIGAQRVCPGRQTVTITGDGCFLMSAMEIATAGRESLPVKFFVLDNRAYHYMQELQRPAYLRTTATMLANLDYRALAQGWNVAYQEILGHGDMDTRIRGVLSYDGPVLTRVHVDYGRRRVRWLKAARDRYTAGLTRDQRARFLARIGYRALDPMPEND